MKRVLYAILYLILIISLCEVLAAEYLDKVIVDFTGNFVLKFIKAIGYTLVTFLLSAVIVSPFITLLYYKNEREDED